MAGNSLDFNSSSVVDMTPEVKAWNAELQSEATRTRDYRKAARKVVKLYEADKKDDYQFNILYSNTETTLPALYNSTPRPDVQPRYKVTDQLPNMASQLCKRVLEFLLDTDQGDYSKFDDAMQTAVLEALVPGQGVTRFKYDYQAEATKDVEAEAEGKESSEKTPPRVTYESICAEETPWDRVHFGYCRQWKDLPWLAFDHFMNKEELVRHFGEEVAKEIPLQTCSTASGDGDDEGADSTEAKSMEGEKLAWVVEIWDKSDRKVKFIAKGYGKMCKVVDDPLGLKHFWPIPKPMTFFSRISSRTPQTLYAFYEEQAEELNVCTYRINKILRAMKVRGFYDGTLEGLDELLKQEDNTLLPATNVAAMLQGQTLESAIWLFPLEKLITVLQQLYVARDQIKQVIYEVTGLSDLIRGSQAASETATASNIKRQWGTIRLKRQQKEVQRYVKDSLRLMAELAFKHLSPETIQKMTGMNLPTQEQKLQAQQLAAMAQQTQQPLPPQVQEILAQPSWDDVLAILQDDIVRDYRIDIETNSTIDADAQEDKQDVAEFMNAMGQFLSGTVPMIEQGVMPFEVMKATLLAITQRFRFGREVEDQLRNMTPPAPKEPDAGENAKAQVAQVQAQADLARIQAESQATQQEMAGKAQLMQQELEVKRAELEIKMQELALKREELAMKQAAAQQNHAMAMEQAAMTHKNAQEAATQKADVQERGFMHKMMTLGRKPTTKGKE